MTLRRTLGLIVLMACATCLKAQDAHQDHAIPTLVLGPQVFTGILHRTLPASVSFPLPALVYGPFTLLVKTNASTGITVNLNGTTVMGPEVITPPAVSQTVFLQPNNQLRISLSGRGVPTVTVMVQGYQYRFASTYASIPALSPSSTVPSTLDASVDWRSHGVVTPVSNEGPCQSDWAFSAVGATESINAITTGRLYRLSTQELIDCANPPPTCSHSNPVVAFNYIVQNGLQSETQYPYTARPGACKAGSNVESLTGFSRIPPGDETTLMAEVNLEPVSVVFNGNWFDNYTGGIADPPCGEVGIPSFAAGLIVGYGEDDSTDPPTPVWIVKTSLGTSWGMAGYFEIVRGQDKCGIADFAIVPQD